MTKAEFEKWQADIEKRMVRLEKIAEALNENDHEELNEFFD